MGAAIGVGGGGGSDGFEEVDSPPPHLSLFLFFSFIYLLNFNVLLISYVDFLFGQCVRVCAARTIPQQKKCLKYWA